MPVDRRAFLKMAGLASAVGIGGGRIIEAAALDGAGTYKATTGALAGKRWAMIIDVHKCLEQHDCTACADICHKIHNVAQFNKPKNELKWIWRENFHGAFPEQNHEFLSEELHHSTFPVLCNHCDDPPCVRVCPTQTTWKRDDGVVMMDMHRCIGCRYCITACPYGSRSFNWLDPRGNDEDGKPCLETINPDFPTRTRGVVEKCNFCAERLAKGQLPACVEGCPGGAMTFGDLDDPESPVRKILHDDYAIRRKPSLGTNPQVYYLV